MWYPVDDITGDKPCHLHIPLGRVGNKTKEVMIGVAMPGRVFYNNPISVEYAKVLVREITNMACIDYPLDHVTPQGIKELEEAVNQFMSLLSQMVMPKDNEALLPMSSPPVPKFKEASLLLSPKEKRKLLCSQRHLSRLCPSRT
jgi:hypothetical protein